MKWWLEWLSKEVLVLVGQLSKEVHNTCRWHCASAGPSGISCSIKNCRITLRIVHSQATSSTQKSGWRGTILCMFMLQPWNLMSNEFGWNSKIQNLRQISNHPLDPYFKDCCLQVKGSILHCNCQLSASQNLARNHANSTKHVLRTMWYIKVSCESVFLERLSKYSNVYQSAVFNMEKFWEVS